jgi:long-chain acyl-CoA synthetase
VFGQTIEVHAAGSLGAATVLNDRLENLIANLAEVRPTVLVAVPRIFSKLYERVHHELDEKPQAIRRVFETAVRSSARAKRGELTSAPARAFVKLADATLFKKIRGSFGGRLKYAISGSAALNPRVAEFIDALGIEVYEGYGLTETSPIVSANVPGARKMGSVGRPIPGVRLRISEGSGEIVVYGPNVMQGYLNRPRETAEALTPDGGLRTGDLGYVDDEGYLYVTGRLKEQYKLENGKYVMPSPLEEQLKLSPYIANVVLYGDNRPFNVALITPNFSALQEWAEREHVELGDAKTNPRVVALLDGELTEYSRNFRQYEKPRAFAITLDEFTVENGMLTPTLKVKRSAVFAKYASTLEALYTAASAPRASSVAARLSSVRQP